MKMDGLDSMLEQKLAVGSLEPRIEQTNHEYLLLVPYSDDIGWGYKVMAFSHEELGALLDYTFYRKAPQGAQPGDRHKRLY